MQGKVFSTVSLVRATAMLSLYQLEYWGCTHCQRMVNSILAVELMLSSVGGTAILWIKSRNRPMKWSADRNQGPCLYRKHNNCIIQRLVAEYCAEVVILHMEDLATILGEVDVLRQAGLWAEQDLPVLCETLTLLSPLFLSHNSPCSSRTLLKVDCLVFGF
jgi:hypothetical protein